MAQTFADLSGGALAASATNVIIPANSQIVDCVFDFKYSSMMELTNN